MTACVKAAPKFPFSRVATITVTTIGYIVGYAVAVVIAIIVLCITSASVYIFYCMCAAVIYLICSVLSMIRLAVISCLWAKKELRKSSNIFGCVLHFVAFCVVQIYNWLSGFFTTIFSEHMLKSHYGVVRIPEISKE